MTLIDRRPWYAANEFLAFLLELAALACLSWWGFSVAHDEATGVLLGVGTPLAAIMLWSLFAAPKARWRQQVAAEIRSGITAGEYKPGSPLPSETQLIERYKVSRPTVRKAIAALRAEGLIEVIHGKGSYVRAIPAPAVTIERTITRTGKTFHTGHHTWEQAETPTIYRTTTTATTGPLLGLDEGEALFGVDRLLTDPKTGTRAMHRVLIPFATAADEAEQLAEAPDTEPEQIYAILTAAGHKLTWQETVSARMPFPDERSTLDIPDATPIMHTARVTLGNHDRPLILEELRASADRAQLTYHITATRPLSVTRGT